MHRRGAHSANHHCRDRNEGGQPRDGKLFLAVILDLLSRMVIGWALST